MAIRKYQPPPVPRDPTLGSMPRPSQQPYQVPSRPTPLRPTGYQVPQRPTTNFWKQRNPPEWGQVQRPIMRKWSPDYQPSYWENPVNIARHYWQLKNRPASEGVPDWIDEKSLDIAYRYMTHIQGSDDWVNWKHINPEDPVRQFLQGMDQPPLDYLLSPADFQRWTIHEMGQTDPENWTPEMMGALSPEMRAQYEQYRETWAQKTPFEELPTWQQLSYHIQSSPALSGAATMVPFAAIGGIGGMAASPVGAFFGAAIPLAIGAGLGSAAAKYPSAANLLNKLDFLAEGTERAIGMGLQVEGALMNEETYGSLQEIMDNLPAAWDASTLTYTTGALGGGRDTGINIGSQKDERLDITNVFPAVEYAFRYITGNEPEIIQFAGGQEVFPRIQVVLDEEGQQYAIGDTGPVEMDAVGLSALVQARRQMIAGADPEQVIAEYTDRFGFSAEFAELAGHMALDPLNILPKLSAKGVATVGRVTDNIPLARAFENAQGPVQGWKQYGNFIRTGLAGPVDELTAAQKFIGGLNEQGIIKELNPENVPTNPINRAYLWMRNMTPDAKARTYTSTMADNLSNMLDFRRGDFNGQISLMREMINSDPAQVAKIAPFLGSPEFATMRQSLASFGKKLDELDALWNTSAPQRDMLHGIARILDDEVPSVLKELHADGAESLYQRLVNKINDTDPELARSLAEDAALGEFTPESLQRLAEAYTGDNPIPWHPDEAAARLWGAFNEHNMDWSIKAYGVEPSKGMTRFFDTLKRGQSVVLLGFNPAYAINNGVNNAVTRAATGIFGYSTPGTIGKFFDRFGYEPYRFEAGVGAAGITPEIKLGISEYEQAIGQRIGSVGQTGEEIIRSATHTPDGKIRQGIDWVNKFGFANKLSSSLERLESQQAFHKGLRQFVDNNWVRGKGFETIPSPLRNSLEQFGSGTAERVMRALEGSLSKEEALSKIYGEVVRYDPDMHIRDVFREFGVDEGVGREALGGIYDDISERLQTAKTPDDVRRTFDEVRRNVDDYLDQQLADELGTRIEQVTTQVGSGGYAEAMHVFIEHELHMAELNTQHFMAWDETFLKAEELRAQGANPEAVSALFEGQKTRANRLWRRARKFERASMRGILEGFGLESTDARRYTVGMDGMSRRWDDYFELVNRERNDFRRTEFETPELREVEYQRMQDRHMEYYDTAIGDVKGIQTGLDELFSEMNRGAFGDDAARAALEYRMRMAELSDTRYQMQRAHREATMHEPADVRRRASADFFNNEYVPFIQEYFRQEIEAAGQYGQSVTGDVPTVEFVRPEAPAPGAAPEAPPQAGQAPPTPEVIEVPPVETPPAAVSSPSTPEMKAEVFAIAQEYGIEGTRIENGQTRFDPGAKVHILNTVKQIDPSIQHFDEITPELARTAFDARETRHAAQDTFAAMVDEITKKYGGMDPAEADAMRARKLGVSMDQYLSNAIDDLPEPTRQLMQTNADLMRQEFEAAQQKLTSTGKGVPITDAEGYVTGGVTYGYPVWYDGVSKYINIEGQKIRGYAAVKKALEILSTGEGFPPRNYKIFDDLKKVGLANHYSSIDEAIAAGLMPAVEKFFQTGTWLDEIGQFQEQLATAILSDPEAAAKMGTDFIALVEDAPLEIQTEFAGLIDEVYNSIGRATESALGKDVNILDRPISTWSRQEYNDAVRAAKSGGENIEVEIFGKEGAKRYADAQRTANSQIANPDAQRRADEIIDTMEGGLSEAQRNKLFGIGDERYSLGDLKRYKGAFDFLDDASNDILFSEIQRNITKVDPEDIRLINTGTVDGTAKEIAYMKVRNAVDVLGERGIGSNEIMATVFQRLSRELSPNDAEVLLKRWFDAAGVSTESSATPARLPAPDADAIVPVGIDPDEYLWFMQQAAENRNNLAHIVDESSRMLDEAAPFPDQSPGEWRADMDGAKVDPEKTLALIESPTREVTPYGPYPPGVVENILQPKYESIHQGQAWAERVTPMLDALEHKLIASAGEGFSLGGKELPPSLKTGLDRYLDGVWKDMSTNKLAGIKWAENLRDQALLNYSQKRGIDTAFQWAFPYMFWYTRSMYQWALRAIDRPAWFANYARARNFMTNRMQVPGFPSRLANKMAVPAPYLPPWAGGNVWVDPVRKLFPIEEFVGPVDYYAKSKSEADRRAESLIVQMQGRGEITAQEASEAFTSRSGKVWERAQAKVQASIQGEQAAPESWMNLIMSPALYLTLPAQLLTGKAPESPLPITRTGNALKAVTENTPLHMVGQVVGSVLSAPENMLRGAAGISEFGEWGDYYVELMLSNMVSEGLLDLDEAIQQMIEKQGPAYEEAVSRTQLEQAFKVPGSLPTYAALHGASAAEFMSAMAFGWLPAGLFPEGELEQRGLAERYKHAREQYNLGDHAALGEFLDEHPELESRMALYDEPDERMRQFMITKVWNLYSDLSGVDKQEARNMFGELFETGFLSNETRNYDLLDTETLAFWANAMGGQVPETEQTIGVLSDPDFLQTKLETAPPLEAAAVDAYRSIRNDNFPNWYALQNAYFSLEKDKRRDFLQRFPELGEYWDWNRGYKESNPVIDKYVKRPDNDDIPVTYDLSFVQDFSPALTRQLFSHYNANTTMTGGTLEEMMYYWNANGRPGGDFEEFIEKVLRDAFAPQ